MGGKANGRVNMKEQRKKPHNHFTTGDTGFVPQGAGQDPHSRHWNT